MSVVNRKCYALLSFSDKAKLCKAKYSIDTIGGHIIVVKYGFRKKIVAVVPEGVKGIPFKKNKLLYVVDADKLVALAIGTASDVVDDEVKGMLGLVLRDKFWRLIGKRVLDWFETLIYMGAGYGLFRLVEILIMEVFKK